MLSIAAPAFAGCSGDPFLDLAGLNPWRREEWREDEQFGMNPNIRLRELDLLCERAPDMAPAEQERVGQDLAMQLGDERNSLFRARMVRAMGGLPTEAARRSLAQAANDPSPLVRIEACDAWARQGGPEALETLGKLVGGDTDIDVRMAAARALGKLNDPGAVQPLGIALDDADPALQNRAMLSLRQVSGRDFGLDVAAWRQFVKGEEPNYEAPSIAQRLQELF